MIKKTICNICGCEINENEIHILNEKILCEDCHMEETHPVKICNPLPVFSARKIGKTNKNSTETLNELQKAIYNYIINNKKATIKQLCKKFELTEAKLTNQIAVLRHLQLVKGKKEEHTIHFVPF
jgi:predicted HTH transcriptional regulator